jgi:hypothetical protein
VFPGVPIISPIKAVEECPRNIGEITGLIGGTVRLQGSEDQEQDLVDERAGHPGLGKIAPFVEVTECRGCGLGNEIKAFFLDATALRTGDISVVGDVECLALRALVIV